MPGIERRSSFLRVTPRAAPAPRSPQPLHPHPICSCNTVAESRAEPEPPKHPSTHPVPSWTGAQTVICELLEIKSGPPLGRTGAEQNQLRRSRGLSGVPDTLPRPISGIPLPAGPEPSRCPGAPRLDFRGDISPREAGQRFGMFSPLSSARAQDFPPLSSPKSRVQLLGLATGSPWGPAAGWSQGQGSLRAGERSAGGLLARRTMQFPKVSRPQRECCLFFGGGGHEDGPQPRRKSPELEKKGAGGAGTGHHLSTEPISPQSETWLWIPRRPPPPPPSPQVVCAVPLRRLFLQPTGPGPCPGD